MYERSCGEPTNVVWQRPAWRGQRGAVALAALSQRWSSETPSLGLFAWLLRGVVVEGCSDLGDEVYGSSLALWAPGAKQVLELVLEGRDEAFRELGPLGRERDQRGATVLLVAVALDPAVLGGPSD
jgi:hypothetical protein